MIGDFAEDAAVRHRFSTDVGGTPTAMADSPAVAAFKDGGTIAITAGVTLSQNLGGVTGKHLVSIDTSADAAYTAGSDYTVEFTAGTLGGVSLVGKQVCSFAINNRNTDAHIVGFGDNDLVGNTTDINTGFSAVMAAATGGLVPSTVEELSEEAAQAVADASLLTPQGEDSSLWDKVDSLDPSVSTAPDKRVAKIPSKRILTVASRTDSDNYDVVGRIRMKPGETKWWGITLAGTELAPGDIIVGLNEEPVTSGTDAAKMTIGGYGDYGPRVGYELTLAADTEPGAEINVELNIEPTEGESLLLTVPVTVGPLE